MEYIDRQVIEVADRAGQSKKIRFMDSEHNFNSFMITAIDRIKSSRSNKILNIEFWDDGAKHKVTVCINNDGLGRLMRVYY